MRQLDLDVINHITYFENSTGARVRDCLVNDDVIYFLVEPGSMMKALGKNGSNIKLLQGKLRKRIKVWEYNDNPEIFIKKLIPSAENVHVNGENISLTIPSEDKGKMIGKGGSNISKIKEMLKRNSEIKNLEIK